MKIAYITAGAAGMYCGSCMHDNTLVTELMAMGHEVILIPTYTPVRTDEEDVSSKQIFFGGINVYLQEKSALFRHTPWFFDKLLNNRRLLNWVSKFSSSTNAADLGALTVSILEGERGHLKKEMAKLTQWLKTHYQPDLVQLTNGMFAGFAGPLKRELGVPVLCGLQGEDIFLDDLIEPHKTRAFRVLGEVMGEVDGFIAASAYYGRYVVDYFGIPQEKVHVVPLGIKLDDVGHVKPDPNRTPYVVGYLARICPEKGLHILVDAFRLLAEKMGRDKVRLKAAGYLSAKDRPYLEDLQRKLAEWGLSDCFAYLGEVDRQGKEAFLQSLDVFSVPTVYHESKGLSILEAMANGLPVVQPRHGSFVEMVEHTNGGVLVEPESPEDLARALAELLPDVPRRLELGEQARIKTHERYSSRAMAENTMNVYRRYYRGGTSGKAE